MTALAMISGKIHRGPDVRTGKSGKPYTALTVKIAVGGAAEFWSCIVFSESAQRELEPLGPGDGVSLVGTLEAKLYEKDGISRVSLNLVADKAISLRPTPRERAAKTDRHHAPTSVPEPRDMAPIDDGLPWGGDR
jgi:single-stranded DNA-binding protein